jgi:hypothetical protein
MRSLAALALCCGCDVVFRLDDVRIEHDASVVPPADAARHCLRDSFDAIDTSLWGIADPASVVAVTADGQLRITPAAGLAGVNFNGLVSKELFDLTDATVTIELVQAATQEANVATQFAIVDMSGANFYMFEVSADKLTGYVVRHGDVVGGTPSFSYSPTQLRFLQFRHVDSNHQLELRMGTTAAASSVISPVSDTAAVQSMFISMSAGTRATGSPAPGQAVFDNLTVALPDCTP